MKKNYLPFLVLFILLYPFIVPSKYLLHLGVMAGLWILLATSMNLMVGYVGQTPLGHTAFWGIGAFTVGLLNVKFGITSILTLLLGALAGVVAGYFLGRLTLKLRGAYFVLATLGFAEVLKLVVINWVALTGGPMGLPGIAPLTIGFPYIFSLAVQSRVANFYLIWMLTGMVLFMVHRLLHSPIGRSLIAISENEALAESVGVNIFKYTMGALLLSAGIAGLAGGFYAQYIAFISPDLFYLTYTVTMLVMVIVGGKRTFDGPIFGAVIFTILPELLRAADQFRMAIYGVLIMITILYFPEGLLSSLKGRFVFRNKAKNLLLDKSS